MDIAATYNAQLSVVRTSEGPGIGQDNTTTINGYNTTETLDGSSTPPATTDVAYNLTLTAGAGNIDLTALVDPDRGAVDGSGLRVQYMKLVNDAAAVMTIAQGASNGYDGFGADFSITLAALGGECLIKALDNGTNISGTNCELDVTGTGSQVLSVQLVMG